MSSEASTRVNSITGNGAFARTLTIKLLMWDVTGFALYYKQLERGTFELPLAAREGTAELSWSELVLVLEGIELKSIKRRKTCLPARQGYRHRA